MPLPAKRNMEKKTGDKVGQEHHYYPLAPKTEQAAVHAGQEHHYVPLVSKSTDSHVSKVASQHQYIPLAMHHDSIPKLPREHNYIPLAVQTESNQKVDLANHQYLPPVSHHEEKKVVKLYEHQYVPLPPKQDSYADINVKAPQLPREHHYYPLPVRAVEKHQKNVHDHHHYIPAVQQHIHHSQLDHRKHGYLPVNRKQEQKATVVHEHQYLPAVRRTEQANGYDRTHHYIPAVQNAKQATQQVHEDHHYVPQASPRKHVSEKVSEHVQLGGSRKSTIQSGHHHHHHHHENHNDVPSRPSSVASSVHHQPHSRTSTVSTVRGAPIQRVQPIQNPYGDHQSVRVVKNVREFVNVFGATHVVPPPTPLAGIPRLPPRSPISHETFQPHCESVKSSRKSSVVSIGNGVQINNAARKSTCSSVTSSRKSSVSSVNGPVIVGGNVVCPTPRSRNATLTQENVHDHYEGEHTDLIHVADMRKLFENYGPAHLPEYASSPYAYIH
ncbi:hypothetical protein L5515_016903 [Caenorhabditis briggsae]|uniref:Uncharacterized protein n=1 Tax=Caenorhabditis briggsae TaxID=6238 RepID=A0AAE9FE74_CAEBR|nr:hypothetical protein L5515_016903 [Caenorhabditis briggsae]